MEGSAARLRAVGAAVVSPAALSLVIAAGDRGWVWLVAVPAWAISAAWLGSYLRVRRRAKDPERHYLALGPEHLRRVDGDDVRELPWAAVRGIDVDEDRLEVRVRAEVPGGGLSLEPRYGELGAYDLADRLEGASRAALGARRSPPR